MRNKLNVTFEGITDTTGYLFSLAKCFMAAVNCSEYKAYTEDIIAASGFAFRMWADAEQLCPSAMSIWEFSKQKEWFENSGLTCGYIERLWGQEEHEEERRMEAVELIKNSIDRGVAAVVWDIGNCEWGILSGYDDVEQTFFALQIDGSEGTVPFEKLGRFEIPILSVLAVTGKEEKTKEQMLSDTKKLAAAHLRGEEWCENAKGLAAYGTIASFITEKLSADTAWNLEYYLGTYAALKWYAWKFFEKYEEQKLAELYRQVYECWKDAFDLKCSKDVTDVAARGQIAELLYTAERAEQEAVRLM